MRLVATCRGASRRRSAPGGCAPGACRGPSAGRRPAPLRRCPVRSRLRPRRNGAAPMSAPSFLCEDARVEQAVVAGLVLLPGRPHFSAVRPEARPARCPPRVERVGHLGPVVAVECMHREPPWLRARVDCGQVETRAEAHWPARHRSSGMWSSGVRGAHRPRVSDQSVRLPLATSTAATSSLRWPAELSPRTAMERPIERGRPTGLHRPPARLRTRKRADAACP